MASRTFVLAAVAALFAASAQIGATCDVDVCFAMSGDAATFWSQQHVVSGATAYLKNFKTANTYSAIQYTTEKEAEKGISKAEKDWKKFTDLVYNAKPNKGMPFLVSGLNYCFAQVVRRRRRSAPKSNRKMVIVLLGPGDSEIGSDPIKRAGLFHRVGGQVYSVGVGKGIKFTTLKNISQTWWRTLSVTDFKNPWVAGLEVGRRICM